MAGRTCFPSEKRGAFEREIRGVSNGACRLGGAAGYIVEIKAVANIVPAHEAQILTYLRMSGLRLGLLFNFHARLLKDGLRRFII